MQTINISAPSTADPSASSTLVIRIFRSIGPTRAARRSSSNKPILELLALSRKIDRFFVGLGKATACVLGVVTAIKVFGWHV